MGVCRVELFKELTLDGRIEVVGIETAFFLQLGPIQSIFDCPRGTFLTHTLDHLTPHLETPTPKLQSLSYNVHTLEPITQGPHVLALQPVQLHHLHSPRPPPHSRTLLPKHTEILDTLLNFLNQRAYDSPTFPIHPSRPVSTSSGKPS